MAARSSFLFTSESVSEGHPDKVADRISDTVVDAFLSKDPEARVACETLVTTQRIVLAGEVRATQPGNTKEQNEAFTQSIIDSLEPLVRAAVKDIGYEQEKFHWNTCHVLNFLHQQSAHIAQGVDAAGNASPSMHVASAVFTGIRLHAVLRERAGRFTCSPWCRASPSLPSAEFRQRSRKRPAPARKRSLQRRPEACSARAARCRPSR